MPQCRQCESQLEPIQLLTDFYLTGISLTQDGPVPEGYAKPKRQWSCPKCRYGVDVQAHDVVAWGSIMVHALRSKD